MSVQVVLLSSDKPETFEDHRDDNHLVEFAYELTESGALRVWRQSTRIDGDGLLGGITEDHVIDYGPAAWAKASGEMARG